MICCILGFPIFIWINFPGYLITRNEYGEPDDEPTLKEAGYWEIGPIEIDDENPTKNWSITASTYDWCNGSGLIDDPYIIENVTIDGQNVNNCIRIDNSDVYFMIKNCTLINGLGEYWHSGGIRLENVSKGTIFNNTCSFNQQGMYLLTSNNNEIAGNIIQNNTMHGIVFYDQCSNNKIIGNEANFNTKESIFIKNGTNNVISGNNVSNNIHSAIGLSYTYNTEIVNNTVNNNGAYGISVQASQNVTVSFNYLQGNSRGMNIYNDQDCNIFDNTVISNEDGDYSEGIYIEAVINVTVAKNSVFHSNMGIFLGGINNNTISENNVEDNYYGIYLLNTDNNTIATNSVKQNHIGIYLRNSDYNNVTGNTLIGNNECIVNQEDCIGNIFENNDCGRVDGAIPGYNINICNLHRCSNDNWQ
jgi:parallel beta-helix repeat protein